MLQTHSPIRLARRESALILAVALFTNVLSPMASAARRFQLSDSGRTHSPNRATEANLTASSSGIVEAQSDFIREIPLLTKDLVYNPTTQMIYASVPSSAGSIGNTITQINPATGNIGASAFIGSEPGKLAISDNGQYIYAFLDGALAVRRFDVVTQTSGLQFTLSDSSSNSSRNLFDMAVLPGKAESIAASYGPYIAIYDNDVRRPTTATSSSFNTYIEPTASADTLYGITVGNSASSNLQKISVNNSGSTISSTTQVNGSGDFRFTDGRIYLPTGQVLDAGTGALQGTFTNVGSNPLVVPDSKIGRVYFLGYSNTGINQLSLRAYDMNTFVFIGSINIAGASGTPTSLIRWGTNGLAFRTGPASSDTNTNAGRVYLIQTSLIPSSDPVPTPTPTPSPTATPSPTPTPATSVNQVALPANDLISDPSRQLLYASVPSIAGSNGNSITAIDPATGAVKSSVFIGSEPGKMAMTDDEHYLYVSLEGAAAVRRFDLTTQSPGLQFQIGPDQLSGLYGLRDLATLPGSPDAVAISRRGRGYYPDMAGVAIYDNGVPRPATSSTGNGTVYIESSDSSSTLYGTGYSSTDGIQKLSINSGGVASVSTLLPVGSGDLRFENGLIFTTYGAVIDAVSGKLKGTFSGITYGSFPPLVVPDTANGRVFFLTSGGGSAFLRAYDLKTFVPLGSLTIAKIQGQPTSLVRWGTNGLAFRTSGGTSADITTASGQIYLIQTSLVNGIDPTPAPTPTPTPAPTPFPPAIDVTRISLPTNDIVYDQVSKKIYASVPSNGGANGNSITPIDPANSTVGTSVFIGSEPNKLALSDNGQYLYSGLDGAAAVRRFDLATQTPGLQFPLGGSQYGGAYKASDLEVLPGKPESIAVLRGSGVAIYDNDVLRPSVASSSASYIEFDTSPDTIYGMEGYTTTSLDKFSITSQGATVSGLNPILGYGDFRIAQGRAYMPSGYVIDVATGIVLGQFSGNNYLSLVAPDPANGRVYFLTGDFSGPNSTLTIKAFDINTFLPIGSVQIPGVSTAPTSLIRWGANGLAFRTIAGGDPNGDQVCIVRTSLIPSAEIIPPRFKLDSATYSVNEFSQIAKFTVIRSGDNTTTASVDYATSDGTAAAGSDYKAMSGTLTFAPGESSKSITVPITNDNVYEPTETFNIILSNSSGGTLSAPSTAVLTIVDNDQKPSVTINAPRFTETNSGITTAAVNVYLSNPSTQVVTLDYATSDGTATAGSDYVAMSGSLTIPAGSTFATINVNVNGDTDIEGDETFFVTLSNAANTSVILNPQSTVTIVNDDFPPDTPPKMQFSASNYNVSEGAGIAMVTVSRLGSAADAVTVDYATFDGGAKQKTDYTIAAGTLQFAQGETTKSFNVLVTDDAYVENNETVNLILSRPTGNAATLGTQSAATLTIINNDSGPTTINPIDDGQFFVRQHYNDFLNRDPEPGGLGYWSDQIAQCGSDQGCINSRRIGVSAAFFIELEFQDTGSFVYHFYKASYGVRPSYTQFMPDRSRVIGGADLEAGKRAFADQWVQRPEFLQKYPASLTGTQYVDALLQTVLQGSGVDLSSQRTALINDYNANQSRARIVRLVADDETLKAAEYNNAFVLMQYFGYLRRDPEQAGYDFWLDVLNNRVQNNYRGMVCAFLTSAEYQDRFSPARTRNDSICSSVGP